MVLSLLTQNAKLLWQHEAAPADQGLAAGGPPHPTPNKPLCEASGSSFGQSEQHLLRPGSLFCAGFVTAGAAAHQSGRQSTESAAM